MSSICPSVGQDIMSTGGTGHNVLLSQAKCPIYVLQRVGHNEQCTINILMDILRTKCPPYVLYVLIINVAGVHGTYTGHIRDIYGTYTRLMDILSSICPLYVLCIKILLFRSICPIFVLNLSYRRLKIGWVDILSCFCPPFLPVLTMYSGAHM